MRFAYRSDIGKRAKNEDYCYVPEDGGPMLLIVADGMGGHNAGMLASHMAVQTVSERMKQGGFFNTDALIRHAVAYANTVIYHFALERAECRGMGTTIVLAVVEGGEYIAANIGDSRLYHYYQARQSIRQVTVDHSFVATLVASGEITPEQAQTHPKRNIITRALGTREQEKLDLFHEKWDKGDILMLCSDGLYTAVRERQLVDILRQDVDLEHKCSMLVDLALNADASDNVTVVLALNDGEVGE
ncbi:MAG: Stp1/IreP family PP2C-type Ser/Thr phosphatase [Bacillota bacterium]